MTSLAWLLNAPKQSKRALLAASLGWLLDSFDVMLYSLVLAQLILDPTLHLSKQLAGTLGSVTLIAAAIGGLAFGLIADRFGRTRALIASVLIYAVFTAACGFAHTVAQLAVFRILLGFGMGGEWASGASLVAESFPDEHRGKALGLMQSSWAIGYALAALVVAAVMPRFGWRGVFFVGVAPALLTLYIRRNVEEPAAWQHTHNSGCPTLAEPGWDSTALEAPAPTFINLFQGRLLPLTVALTLMNACCLFAWWGFNLWVPAYLSLPLSRGGIGLSTRTMTSIIVVMQAGMWLGYIAFGILADRFGRKRTYIVYLLFAAVLMLAFGATHTASLLYLLAPLTAFAATGYFTGFAAVTAEIYETRIRSTAQGFTYNTGRIASAIAPFAVGALAGEHGFGAAFVVAALAFLAAALLWFWIPETLNRTAGAS